MVENKVSGTITLPTATAVAIWNEELTGQISDGMWENARPHDHWIFWCRLEAVVGEVGKVTRSGKVCGPFKTRYGFESLFAIEEIRERMLEMGKAIDAGYTMKSMKADIKSIKLAMRTLEHVY